MCSRSLSVIWAVEEPVITWMYQSLLLWLCSRSLSVIWAVEKLAITWMYQSLPFWLCSPSLSVIWAVEQLVCYLISELWRSLLLPECTSPCPCGCGAPACLLSELWSSCRAGPPCCWTPAAWRSLSCHPCWKNSFQTWCTLFFFV